uniref:cGMP-dependent protein kinase n=1 Tax=Eucampia antarctica TaxID=49252 RepID=A0A7S2VZA2_9STRA|mmetsp:Transcript_13413/g.13004  ORF Transcript_13413/g.13004 Transcript_13413/m.13004 type:complete len:786 (+) Transcript_13413:26-2383(+)|eukprot:CAMPEP_0197828736 /NCGR_PEP_ID=MMETSP1437-20131217/5264_1 /TAXON_ID=49252 ORGANISM="Eucampia antarctica, Strain CCMP1452" /NCGR_SAMPLE_ID=MMETSP1437 /ASSEMBLY_ACC=CAM_ASM_001096 /LENGTH=785 /DNA_ID=CAMNT_0043430087 /DNA_START=22 /DNA_END=2379 /DNA_ORIENTATION=+
MSAGDNNFLRPSTREEMLVIHQKVKSDAPVDSGDNLTKKRREPHRFKDIFAAPIKFVTGFKAPNFRKPEEEKQFIKTCLVKNFIFAGLEEDELETLVNAMEKRNLPKDAVIIEEGNIGDYFYIIHSGEVKFNVGGKDSGTATKGSSFGELALLYDCPRAASCTTMTPCSVWRVHQNTFRKILAGKQMDNADEIRGILRNVPFLSNLDTKYLNKMIESIQSISFAKGELIIRKGDEGKVFYILKSGRVKIHDIIIGQSKYDDQTLGRGDYFGERAIVTLEPRAANITALEKCEAYCLTRQAFIEHLGDFEDLVRRSSDLRCLVTCPLFGHNKIETFEANALVEQVRDIDVKEGTILFEDGKVKFLYGEEGAICFLRSGEVTITKGGKSSVATSGEYFGVDTILSSGEEKFNAIATKKSSFGVLTKNQITSVVKDVQRLAMQQTFRERMNSCLDTSIKFSDLKKHRLLGLGTFGKVWLMTNETLSRKVPYALKIQKKQEIIDFKQVQGIMREKSVMAMLNHPFIIKLVNTYQDSESLYMLLPLVQGGELFSMLHQVNDGKLPESHAKFYAATILEGLAYMHKRNILYRDLKPENILIGLDGYPVIVDMGFAKAVIDKTYTLCGTPLYIAPEVIMNRGHNIGADQWSWAVLLYEMIYGNCPFYVDGMDQMGLFKSIVRVRYSFPEDNLMSKSCQNLIAAIFKPSPSTRLGLKNRGDDDIKDHVWFADDNFDDLVSKEIEAPWIPTTTDAFDVSAFDNFDHIEDTKLPPVNRREQEAFADFGDYVTTDW